MPPPSLAVVVIARNEEKTVGDCIASCLESVRFAKEQGLIGDAEIVLVDSASSDRTREIAGHLSVRILSLPSHWPLSAAAGRFIGLTHTSSDLVFFVDGDYVLEPSWLVQALPELKADDIAGVCGVDREKLPGTNSMSRYVLKLTERAIPTERRVETEVIAIGVYQRVWIDRAGGIQPFLRGAEDRDLAIRVRAIGGRLIKTKEVMGVHHWTQERDLTFIEYFSSVARWSYGEGQAARNGLRDPYVFHVYRNRYFNVRSLIGIETGLCIALWWTGAAILGLISLSFGLLALVVGFAIMFRGTFVGTTRLREAVFQLHQVPYVLVRLGCFALGFLHPPRPADQYPRELPNGQ